MEINLPTLKRRKKMTDDSDIVPPIPKTAMIRKPRTPSEVEAFASAKAEWKRLEDERDQIKAENAHAMDLVKNATATIRKLDAEISELKARGTSYQLERDEAVAKFAKLEGLLMSVQAMLRAHAIPLTPIVREMPPPDMQVSREH